MRTCRPRRPVAPVMRAVFGILSLRVEMWPALALVGRNYRIVGHRQNTHLYQEHKTQYIQHIVGPSSLTSNLHPIPLSYLIPLPPIFLMRPCNTILLHASPRRAQRNEKLHQINGNLKILVPKIPYPTEAK